MVSSAISVGNALSSAAALHDPAPPAEVVQLLEDHAQLLLRHKELTAAASAAASSPSALPSPQALSHLLSHLLPAPSPQASPAPPSTSDMLPSEAGAAGGRASDLPRRLQTALKDEAKSQQGRASLEAVPGHVQATLPALMPGAAAGAAPAAGTPGNEDTKWATMETRNVMLEAKSKVCGVKTGLASVFSGVNEAIHCRRRCLEPLHSDDEAKATHHR